MKKALCLLLALMLTLGLPAGIFAAQTEAAAPVDKPGLPSVGETAEGFTVKDRDVHLLTGSETVLFEHDKTGALVYYVASDFVDRSFTIAFRTPILDDKGIQHVFEHATISGSDKYPAQNLLFSMANTTYGTYLNAMTYSDMTAYPMSSLSEEQLLVYADYYLDGVFNPMLLEEERLYRREAWRYELADAEAPITVSGTVYNEMKGMNTINYISTFNILNALFPESKTVFNSVGGVAEDIRTMTWDDLREFHAAYYHPSNMFVTMFGDLDHTKFLKLMDDEYLSGYDRKKIELERGEAPPLSEPVFKTYSFPMEANANTEKASILSYGFAFNGADYNELTGMEYIMAYLMHDSSPLTANLQKALPGANFNVTNNFFGYPTGSAVIVGTGLDPEDAEVFQTVIDESLLQISEEGIDAELIKALLDSGRINNLSLSEYGTVGINVGLIETMSWATRGEVGGFNKSMETIDFVESQLDEGYLDELLAKNLIENNHKAVTVTMPDPGKVEEAATALAEELAEMKAAMTDEEIAALVESTAEMAVWSAEEPPAEILKKTQVINADNLPVEAREYEINEREEDGVRYLTVEANVSGIGQTMIYLNTSGVPAEDVQYLNLYSKLISELGTASYSKEEAKVMTTGYLNAFNVGAGMISHEDGYIPALIVGWKNLDENYEEAAALVNELLFTTDYSDIETIKSAMERMKANERSYASENAPSMQINRALASGIEEVAYYDSLSGWNFYKFLTSATEAIESDPEAFIQKLNEVKSKFAVRDKVNVLYAGSPEGIEEFNENIDAALAGLADGEIEPADYRPEPMTHSSEAIIADSAVQYNLLFAPLEDLGLEFDGKLLTIGTILSDAYVTPLVRQSIGAYGGNFEAVDNGGGGFLLYSYRDPSVTETFAVYDGIADFVEELEITQEEVDNYIVRVFSYYATPEGELTGAISAMIKRIGGKPDDLTLRRMREVKTLTVEDIKGIADELRQMTEEGFRSTVGGAAVIEEHKDLYEVFVDLNAA